jgi:hypothetical protein
VKTSGAPAFPICAASLMRAADAVVSLECDDDAGKVGIQFDSCRQRRGQRQILSACRRWANGLCPFPTGAFPAGSSMTVNGSGHRQGNG